MAYTNGEIPSAALHIVAGRAYLTKPTANAFARAIDGAKRAGASFSTFGPFAGYRSKAVQAAMRAAFIARSAAAMAKYNMSMSSTATPAPAGYSPHGMGIAVDLATSAPYGVAKAIMAKYGFHPPFPGDPWHFVHDGKTAIGSLETVKKAVRTKRTVYTIKGGDTLGAIAKRNHVSLHRVMVLNPKIKNANLIKAGQKIYLS